MPVGERYRVLRSLGVGAAGGVFLVEDRVLGGPPLALKRVQPSSDPSFRDSFAREFAVLSSLSLPGVARVHDLGVMKGQGGAPAAPFFTRSFVDGAPLDRYLEGRPLSQVIELMLSVLQTVSALHRLGVVHGDLKPANIIVDDAGRASLIDFGLSARITDPHRLRGSGTPAFMAPELFRGQPVSPAADVYALGATLWALVTGAMPLEELSERALGAKLRGELPKIPVDADAIARRVLAVALLAMADDPRQRPPSADELSALLERAARAAGLAPAALPAQPFVAPRTRGRAEVLRQLEQAAVSESDDAAAITVLHGARGMGKSTVLRELKWRLQLAGARVIELHGRGGGLDPFAQLLRQAALGREGERERIEALSTRLERGEADGAALSEGVCAVLAADQPAERIVLLVDDLDAAEPSLAEALRAAVHAGSVAPPRAVITCEDVQSPCVALLGSRRELALSPLLPSEQQQLIREALGPVDATAEAALLEHAQGNPGVLVEALAQLWDRPAVTPADIASLSPSVIGDGVTRRRIEGLSEPARRLAAALAAVRGPVGEAFLRQLLGATSSSAASEELSRAGVLRTDGVSITLNDLSLRDGLRRDDSELGARAVARRMLEHPEAHALDVAALAQLALLTDDGPGLTRWGPKAAESLARHGANVAAAELYTGVLRHAAGELEQATRLSLAETCLAMGDHVRAVAHAQAVAAEPSAAAQLRARGRIVAGRAHVAAGQLEEAVRELSEIGADVDADVRAEAARELARAHLRRGEHALAKAAVDTGLLAATRESGARAELLAIDGMLHTMSGAHAEAHARYAEALSVAQRAGTPRDEAQARGYAAMGYEREGAFERAHAEYERCLSAARAAGDLGLTATYAMNLGNVSFRLGRTDVAEENYTLAARLARRAGRVPTALLASSNLAHLHVYLGLYARARSQADAVLEEARRMGLSFAVAQATHILADADARTQDFESALSRYEIAASAYQKLGRIRELPETLLDAAEALLERAGPSDASAASTKLAQARELVERHQIEDFRLRLRHLLACARAANGDVEGAVRDLERCEQEARRDHDDELLWKILDAASGLLRSVGSELRASRAAREAAEILEVLCGRIPPSAREAFRNEPRRSRVLELARSQRSARGASSSQLGVQTTAFADRRFDRLLEIIKRLAREHDRDRLLERITDAAVELSGAERGFVLLVDERGQLAPHTVRGQGGGAEDPHVAFSRSIAEAVLIDGEPIITVNARDDQRVNEFMSVHRLMLKSIACIPINGHAGTVGVLYLEHRLRAGRFQESDLDLLLAFADQAAIALENARLWAENERRQQELERSNHALAAAKDEIERLLFSRTEELEEARRDLGRARAQLEGIGKKHGIVGSSEGMRRVLALVERVQDTAIPVVIQGESGTGKELFARAIHYGGQRRKAPFIAVNCAAVPESLLESELFGHVRGAFTGADRDKKGLFAQADGGTLFLDEFADMPMRMQVDLLRVLQEGRVRPVGGEVDQAVDVRVIAASNRSLHKLLAERRLREDLYYRLSVVEIHLPALRERPDDIPLLCEHFLSRIARDLDKPAKRLSRAALQRIVESGLPGNVRQLEHLLLSASMMCDGTLIEAADLSFGGLMEAPAPSPRVQHKERPEPAVVNEPQPSAAASDWPSDVDGFKEREKQRILAALEDTGWNRAKAAQQLGMPRRTFYRRLSEFEIL